VTSLGRLLHVASEEGPLVAAELVVRKAGGVIFGADRTYFGIASLTDRLYDWRTGLDTGGVIQLEEMGINKDAGRYYIGMAPRTWKVIFKHLSIDPSKFTYIDLGCGKGRTLLFARDFGFRRRIGVDISPRLIETACENCSKKSVAAELVCADATQYEFPEEPLVVFMYNPFLEDVMRAVAAKLSESLRRRPRQVYVVYFQPGVPKAWADWPVFYLDDAIYPRYTIYGAETAASLQ